LNSKLKIHKLNSNINKSFKNSIICFSPQKKRIIEGKIDIITFYNSSVYIDFGFRAEIESFLSELLLRIPSFLSITAKCNFLKRSSLFEFKLIALQSFFLHEIIIEKHYLINFNLFIFLFSKQKMNKKRYIKGRVLNLTKGGYCIGISGFVGFLPNSHTFLKLKKVVGAKNNFYIIKIDKKKQSFVLSQRHLDKIVKRRLLKLGSRINFLKTI
jgi:DNA-directed RNA polymerase subunit E'/Rpb7